MRIFRRSFLRKYSDWKRKKILNFGVIAVVAIADLEGTLLTSYGVTVPRAVSVTVGCGVGVLFVAAGLANGDVNTDGGTGGRVDRVGRAKIMNAGGNGTAVDLGLIRQGDHKLALLVEGNGNNADAVKTVLTVGTIGAVRTVNAVLTVLTDDDADVLLGAVGEGEGQLARLVDGSGGDARTVDAVLTVRALDVAEVEGNAAREGHAEVTVFIQSYGVDADAVLTVTTVLTVGAVRSVGAVGAVGADDLTEVFGGAVAIRDNQFAFYNLAFSDRTWCFGVTRGKRTNKRK